MLYTIVNAIPRAQNCKPIAIYIAFWSAFPLPIKSLQASILGSPISLQKHKNLAYISSSSRSIYPSSMSLDIWASFNCVK